MISKIINTIGTYKGNSVELLFSVDENDRIPAFNIVDDNFKLLGSCPEGRVLKVLPNGDLILKLDNGLNAFVSQKITDGVIKQNDLLKVRLTREPKDSKPFSAEIVDEVTQADFDYISVFKEITGAKEAVTVTDQDNPDLWLIYSLTGFLDRLCKPVKYLKDGSNILIEHTKALTVIDVNSGSNDCRAKNYFLEINKQAAFETSRQLRLNNISGMILIDFINMDSKEDYRELEEYFKLCLKNDYCKTKVLGFTKLGLMEITRERKFSPLYTKLEQFC